MAVGLLVGAWIARHLGPMSYGELANALAFVALFQAFAGMGVHATLVRDLARNQSQAPLLLGSALWIRLLSGLASWIVAIAIMAIWHGTDSLAFLLTLLVGMTLVLQASDVVDLWFQSCGRNHRTVLARLAAVLASSAVRIGLILADAPVAAFSAAVALESLLVALALTVAYRRDRHLQAWKAKVAQMRGMLSECWPFAISGLAAMVYSRADQMIVREFAGPTQAGLYAVTVSLSSVWAVLPIALQTSLAPLIARLKQEDEQQYRETLVRVFRLFFLIGLAASVGTAALSTPLVTWLFGPAYSESSALLSAHVFTNVFICLGVSHTLWIVNEGRLMLRLWGNVCAAVLAVAANLWLVPIHGPIAASWVAVAAQFLATMGINAALARESFWLQLRAITGMRLGRI